MSHSKWLKPLLSLALAASVSTIAVAEDLPKAKLNVVGSWSNLSQYKDFEYPFWTKEIPEKSNGAITAQIKGLNELGLKGGEIGRLMQQGVIQFASIPPGYLASDDPRNEVIDLAGLSPDIETARKVTEAYRPVLEKLYAEKYDAKLLGVWPFSSQVLYCKAPITGLKDLAGKKVRTGNRTLTDFVGALGGTGVTLTFAEVVQALQTGVVDCAITGTLSGYSAKWYEVSDYLYTLPVGWSQVVHSVSNKAWDKLDPKTQAFLQKEIQGLEDRIWIAADKETAEGIACNTGNAPCPYGDPAKMQAVEFSDADRDALHKLLEDVVVKSWSQRCGPACSADFNETVGPVVGITLP
ncbi:TRAP transporter substrate-binding protein [Pollutimonas thiosulfatoxidans]|uniref:TRAP transporter substrate-binding protein DctP n=1 Tax=Pollutimonas thiosulfatoxidans TaxID=2028345 RepID=A0A410GG94_9BURK|nr:TRAP transporter substrate-binding protein [Pollutimonas thiosulfatoxidans]MBF6618118.1 TRAP transporter substrate-binding protein [Candidimonas sp.]NYT45513.1 TRAP transporter substrate-binding protein [Alcaligenaceae bacterium]QAA95300.1 TRAP transporter substrate-binding protein DctP [Pollutimonas thiosulfatoxidans]